MSRCPRPHLVTPSADAREPEQPGLRARIRTDLRELDLACSCAGGLRCHGDELLRIANETPDD